VVARHEDHLAPGAQARADRPEHRLGRLHRPPRPALEQLDDVPQQNQAVDAVERTDQGFERLRRAQDVTLQARAEMHV